VSISNLVLKTSVQYVDVCAMLCVLLCVYVGCQQSYRHYYTSHSLLTRGHLATVQRRMNVPMGITTVLRMSSVLTSLMVLCVNVRLATLVLTGP